MNQSKAYVTSMDLFAGDDSLLIEHAGDWYLLHKRASGGLLLTRWMQSMPKLQTASSAEKRERPRLIGLYGRIRNGADRRN